MLAFSRKPAPPVARSHGAAIAVRAVERGGEPLRSAEREYFEPRFGHDFGRVRVHAGGEAADAARAVGARAYTLGPHIAFGAGEYAPGTAAGNRLLAHELAHVVQQSRGATEVQRQAGDAARGEGVAVSRPGEASEQEADRVADQVLRMPATSEEPAAIAQSTASPMLQRTVREGHDHGGRYEIDDEACAFTYHQNWFFRFETDQTPTERDAYMEAARRQIEDVWSSKFPLVPGTGNCPCSPAGFSVAVVMHPFARNRQGRGFDVIVSPTEERGFTNQPLRTIDLGETHDVPVSTGEPGGQRRIAHEFGHTIGLTDEYHGWAALFNTEGSRDNPSIMHSGDEVRPRHYQHFADVVNQEIGSGCTYSPAGRRMPEHENPVERFRGFPFSVLPQSTEFMIGLNYDRRIGNTALLGLIYPTVGMTSLYDPTDRSVLAGPSVGLRLNQIAHPLYVDVRTGILFDPAAPTSAPDIRLPVVAELGIRGRGFEVGASYTGIVDILGSGRWTHIVGVNLEIPLP